MTAVKRILGLVALVMALALPSPAAAEWEMSMPIRQAGNIGVGFGAGTFATGLSLKYFPSSSFAIQGNAGWFRNRFFCDGRRCYGGGDSLALSVDFLVERPTIAGGKDVELAWNFGAGVGLGIHDDRFVRDDGIALGVSGVLGLELLINVIPIDIVIEYRPNLVVVPGVRLDLIDFGGHVRFYF